MSSSNRSRMTRNMVKPIVVAVALALPGAAAFAADMSNVVTTRADQNIDEQYGRDSVYAFSRDAKPLKPEQQGSHEMGFLGDAFHKTTGFVAGAWHKTTSMFHRDDGMHATYTALNEPQRYGRAGGYIGSDRVAVIAGTPDTTATANADTVKTGQELDNAAATRSWADHRDQSTGAAISNPPNEPSVVTAPAVEDQPAPSASADSVGTPANDSAMSRDESSPVITAPVVEEQRDMSSNPSGDDATDRSSAAAEQRPMDQSAAPADDVVRTSPTPASDNGRVDSATDQKELDTQTQTR